MLPTNGGRRNNGRSTTMSRISSQMHNHNQLVTRINRRLYNNITTFSRHRCRHSHNRYSRRNERTSNYARRPKPMLTDVRSSSTGRRRPSRRRDINSRNNSINTTRSQVSNNMSNISIRNRHSHGNSKNMNSTSINTFSTSSRRTRRRRPRRYHSRGLYRPGASEWPSSTGTYPQVPTTDQSTETSTTVSISRSKSYQTEDQPQI